MRKLLLVFGLAVVLITSLTKPVRADDDMKSIELNDSYRLTNSMEKDEFLSELSCCDMLPAKVSEILSFGSDKIQIYRIDDSRYVISAVIGKMYTEGKYSYWDNEWITLALETIQYDNNYSASGIKYGIASSCTVYYTVRADDPLDAAPDFRFNSISAVSTNLPTATTTVSRMDYRFRLFHSLPAYDVYLVPFTVYNPLSGVSYTNALNGVFYSSVGNSARIEMDINYTNGQSYSIINYLF